MHRGMSRVTQTPAGYRFPMHTFLVQINAREKEIPEDVKSSSF
jgi:hypothetical protein